MSLAFRGLLRTLSIACLLFTVSKGDGSLADEIRQIREILTQRESADEEQRAEISRLIETLQSLTAPMERYVALLEDGSDHDEGGDGVGSCSAQMALIQNRMGSFQESLTQQLGDLKDSFRNCTGTEQRPNSTSSPTRRKTLASIQPAVQVHTGRSRRGFWGRDVVRNDSIIYVAEGSAFVNTLKEYLNEDKLKQGEVHRVHNLTRLCVASSMVVRDRRLLCGKLMRDAITMIDLDTDRWLVTKNMPDLEVLYYFIGPGGNIDLAADEEWVWALYALRHGDHLHLDKLDPETLETVSSWETPIVPREVGETFMISGTLYSLNSSRDTPSFIKHVFNPEQGVSRTLADGELVMPTFRHGCGQNWPAAINMLNFDRRERALYARNCGIYLEKYPVELSEV